MIFLATNLTYFLATIFLNPRSNYAGRNPPVAESVADTALSQYNLNDKTPLVERWWTWFTGVITRWDWGKSPVGESVNDQVSFRIWNSAELLLGATILMTLIGIGLAVWTASRQYSATDRTVQFTSTITMNLPIVVAGLGIVLLAIWLNQTVGTRIFFVTGSRSDGVSGFGPVFVDVLQHLTLPTITLVLTGYAGTYFMQRSLLLDNINADYVRTARAKGLTRQQAVRKHALRTSLIPVVTSVAFSIPGMFTGAVLTETVFQWEGMGRYFITTIAKNDIHGVVAIAAFGALMTAIGAILADIAVVAIDPRVRVS
ncbi:ABC transporter permease [Microbacterium gorillae]|uniref:ABC transporter permease n=1 Tax=Microbacterium gorillae TaxID=1231063 RepID=UPI001E3B4D16|nr:ABC transporter permease [Microbacterium gorillae]